MVQTDSLDCSYAIRYVDLNHRNTAKPWSLRQTAVYHQYVAKSGASTWIMVSASINIKRCVDDFVENCGDPINVNPFELHILILGLLLANWRPYIVHLTQMITEKVGEHMAHWSVLYAKSKRSPTTSWWQRSISTIQSGF